MDGGSGLLGIYANRNQVTTYGRARMLSMFSHIWNTLSLIILLISEGKGDQTLHLEIIHGTLRPSHQWPEPTSGRMMKRGKH